MPASDCYTFEIHHENIVVTSVTTGGGSAGPVPGAATRARVERAARQMLEARNRELSLECRECEPDRRLAESVERQGDSLEVLLTPGKGGKAKEQAFTATVQYDLRATITAGTCKKHAPKGKRGRPGRRVT